MAPPLGLHWAGAGRNRIGHGAGRLPHCRQCRPAAVAVAGAAGGQPAVCRPDRLACHVGLHGTPHGPRPGRDCQARRSDPDRPADADPSGGPARRLRRDRGHGRRRHQGRAARRGPVRAVRHPGPGHRRCRAGRLRPPASPCRHAQGRRWRRPALPPAHQQRRAQGRQPGGLLHPLGRSLRLHGRAGCRQPDGRRHARHPDRPDGREPACRHRPDRPLRRRPGDAVRPHAAVLRPALHTHAGRGPDLLAGRGRQLLGPQRHHPRRPVHGALRAAGPAGPGAVRRGDTLPRRRRGRTDARRRLGRVGAAASHGKL